MKYFLIAGEASGDLHAAHLMQALVAEDPSADFRYFGGDRMVAVGGRLLRHYRDLAYMGFIPVLLHLRTILRGVKQCEAAIAEWRPDVVILVDYPGFNLRIARFVREAALCPVFYYISPKIWAWKEHRIHAIRRDVTHLYSILPFEVEFFEGKHHYPITYVGNPTVDEVAAWQAAHPAVAGQAGEAPLIALLPGSRRQEVDDNLSRMLRAAAPYADQGYRLAIACAPALPLDFYRQLLDRYWPGALEQDRCRLVVDGTYALLSQAVAALVTSGTATLETALFRVPQVVCYYVGFGWFVSLLRRLFLKVPYISLVNLVCREEVVPELVADGMTVEAVRRHLSEILPGGSRRVAMLEGYARMAARLGEPGAPRRAAADMVARLRRARGEG